MDIRFSRQRFNEAVARLRALRRLVANVRRIDLGGGRERGRRRQRLKEREGGRKGAKGHGTRRGGERAARGLRLPVTARLIIARRVPIYERVVTDVERRRTNSVGDIYNLRGRRVADRTGLEFHSEGLVSERTRPVSPLSFFPPSLPSSFLTFFKNKRSASHRPE